MIIVIVFLILNLNRNFLREYAISFLVGLIFGTGLLLGGMCRQSKIYAFLTLNDAWDPSLMFVMVGAIALNLVTFNLMLREGKTPVLAEKY